MSNSSITLSDNTSVLHDSINKIENIFVLYKKERRFEHCRSAIDGILSQLSKNLKPASLDSVYTWSALDAMIANGLDFDNAQDYLVDHLRHRVLVYKSYSVIMNEFSRVMQNNN